MSVYSEEKTYQQMLKFDNDPEGLAKFEVEEDKIKQLKRIDITLNRVVELLEQFMELQFGYNIKT